MHNIHISVNNYCLSSEQLAPGWNPCKPYAEDAPVLVERHAKVTNDAKLYLPPS